jgi:DNA anti-recombination protein RmuC
MERMAWTDERLEERFNGIDQRFDEIDRRFDQVDRRFEQVDKRFEQVDKRFDRVEGEIVELRREMRNGFDAIQSLLNRAGAGIIVCLMGVILAVILQGT